MLCWGATLSISNYSDPGVKICLLLSVPTHTFVETAALLGRGHFVHPSWNLLTVTAKSFYGHLRCIVMHHLGSEYITYSI